MTDATRGTWPIGGPHTRGLPEHTGRSCLRTAQPVLLLSVFVGFNFELININKGALFIQLDFLSKILFNTTYNSQFTFTLHLYEKQFQREKGMQLLWPKLTLRKVLVLTCTIWPQLSKLRLTLIISKFLFLYIFCRLSVIPKHFCWVISRNKEVLGMARRWIQIVYWKCPWWCLETMEEDIWNPHFGIWMKKLWLYYYELVHPNR